MGCGANLTILKTSCWWTLNQNSHILFFTSHILIIALHSLFITIHMLFITLHSLFNRFHILFITFHTLFNAFQLLANTQNLSQKNLKLTSYAIYHFHSLANNCGITSVLNNNPPETLHILFSTCSKCPYFIYHSNSYLIYHPVFIS